MRRTLTAAREALGQAYGYLRWCLPQGHLWSGPDPDQSPDLAPPDWRGVCVTCGKVAPPRPSWRRFILMGACVPHGEPTA